MFSKYQLSLRFGVSYLIDNWHLSKKTTSVYSTNPNKKTILLLKNFQTPPTVILCPSSSLFQIQFLKWNPDIFWTPATFTPSLSPLSLSNLIPEIKHYSLSYPNSLPLTIASSIFLLPQCSSPTYGASSHSHCQASPVQRDQPFISSENHLYSFSSIIVGLENLGHFLTHRFRRPTTQKGNFPILSVSFQYIFTSSFSFSSCFFATTDGFFTYHKFFFLKKKKKKKKGNILVWKGDR